MTPSGKHDRGNGLSDPHIILKQTREIIQISPSDDPLEILGLATELGRLTTLTLKNTFVQIKKIGLPPDWEPYCMAGVQGFSFSRTPENDLNPLIEGRCALGINTLEHLPTLVEPGNHIDFARPRQQIIFPSRKTQLALAGMDPKDWLDSKIKTQMLAGEEITGEITPFVLPTFKGVHSVDSRRFAELHAYLTTARRIADQVLVSALQQLISREE